MQCLDIISGIYFVYIVNISRLCWLKLIYNQLYVTHISFQLFFFLFLEMRISCRVYIAIRVSQANLSVHRLYNFSINNQRIKTLNYFSVTMVIRMVVMSRFRPLYKHLFDFIKSLDLFNSFK